MRGLWRDDATRTNRDEVVALTRAGELVVSTDRYRLTGVVRVQRLDGETGEFGMLAADPAVGGRGIGRGGGCRYMQREVLVPRDWRLTRTWRRCCAPQPTSASTARCSDANAGERPHPGSPEWGPFSRESMRRGGYPA